jgi:hypothetical protein
LFFFARFSITLSERQLSIRQSSPKPGDYSQDRSINAARSVRVPDLRVGHQGRQGNIALGNMNMKKALHLGICLAAFAAAPAPAAAEPKGASAQTAVSAEAAGTAAAADKKYCVRDAINSRIMRSFCRTAKEWENVGTSIEAKD